VSLENIEIGVDDLVVVACAAMRELVAGIEFDGKAIPARPGQVYPEDAADLPVHQVYSSNQYFEYGAGHSGNRMVRMTITINVVSVFGMPIVGLAALERKAGRVRAEILERLASSPHLLVDGKPWATGVTARTGVSGLVGGGKQTNLVQQLQIDCTIDTREGSRLPLSFH